jgi:diguanylate cyclase (GGDEF)-like protein/PAS domain S-box-containing protein
MLGYEPDELTDHYSEWRNRLHPDDIPKLEYQLKQHISETIPYIRLEHRLQCKDGSWKWFQAHGRIVTQSLSGKPLRLVGFAIDITEHRVVADRLRLSANLFEHLHEGLVITDVDYRIVDVNRAYERLSGKPREHLKGDLPELLNPSIQNAETLSDLWASLRTQGTWRGEAIGVRSDGISYPQQVTMSVVKDENALITHHVLVVSDITQSRLARQQLEFQAHYDTLTQLPNRLRLLQLMRKAITTVDGDGKQMLAICYLDMDHFKPVNDRFGHGVGDQLLADLASRMRGAMRGGDAVARMGGDEFALLLRVRTKEECEMALNRILHIVTQPYELENQGLWTLTASIGVTLYPLDHANTDTLLRHADHAMYEAKQRGRNQVQFFDAENDRQTAKRNAALRRLEDAINVGELLLHYQPKINLKTGDPLGVEALLRWQHPQRGLLPPSDFLPLSETAEIQVHLGRWVLGQAIEQLARWRQQGIGLSVSVNIAGAHLQHPDFVKDLSALLAQAHLENAIGLELEVLEHSAFDDVELTARIMESCRSLGIQFALDDFGTGYSTLTYLKRLPVEVLKIDRSFVRSMLGDAQDLAIVEGIIGLSHTFGCAVVAEGVESLEHARQLVALGCEIGQGYGIANPMAPEKIVPWLDSRESMKFIAAISGQSVLF